MNSNFQEKLQKWLDTEYDSRDWDEGARLLLSLNRNKIMYRNLSRNAKARSKFIMYQINKCLKRDHKSVAVAGNNQVKENTEPKFSKGKREDHDLLPLAVQALYDKNLELSHSMRAQHEKVKLVADDDIANREALLKELADMDALYHKNWDIYDHYIIGGAAPQSEADAKLERSINMALGRYKKNPTDKVKENILANYAKMTAPDKELTAKITVAGLL